MSEFEVGRTYKPRYGSEKDVFTVTRRDYDHVYFTRPTVQNMEFKERVHQLRTRELLRTDPWTTSDDVY